MNILYFCFVASSLLFTLCSRNMFSFLYRCGVWSRGHWSPCWSATAILHFQNRQKTSWGLHCFHSPESRHLSPLPGSARYVPSSSTVLASFPSRDEQKQVLIMGIPQQWGFYPRTGFKSALPKSSPFPTWICSGDGNLAFCSVPSITIHICQCQPEMNPKCGGKKKLRKG